MVPLMCTHTRVSCQASSLLTPARWHVVQRGSGASRRRMRLRSGMIRCFRHKRRPHESQSPPAVSANSTPHSSHLNGTILSLAIPHSPIHNRRQGDLDNKQLDPLPYPCPAFVVPVTDSALA